MSEASHAEIDVQQAVRIAKEYVKTTFADDRITNIALEEVKIDDYSREWQITIGFIHPWDKPRAVAGHQLSNFTGKVLETKRTYKAVRVSPEGKVLDVSIRMV